MAKSEKIKTLIDEVRPNAIWDVIKWIGLGVVAMVGLLITAIVQRYRGIPYDLVGILIVGVAWVLLVSVAYVLGKLLNKRANKDEESNQTTQVEKLEARIKELEGERDALETNKKEYDNSIRQREKTIRQLQNDVQDHYVRAEFREREIEALQANYGWLHEMAEAQAKDIGSCVMVERVRFCYHEFIAPIPYLIFAVDIRNKSVFGITIEDEMKGHIKIAGERLLGEKELIDNPKISPSGMGSLTIKQRLSPTEVNLVAVCEKEPLGAFYYFDKLEIMIAARTELPYFDRTPLNLPQHISSKDDEIAQLKNELNSLHRRSETIITLSLALGGAYTLANLFEAGEPPSKERIEHWFNSTLRGHIHPDDLEALCEGLPELTDSPAEQKELIDKYCFSLRNLIRKQRQKQ